MIATGAPKSVTDFRPTLRRFMAVNSTLNDPLTRPANLEVTTSGTIVAGSYTLWFGYPLVGEKLMRRMGDRWTYTRGPGDVESFSLLASDYALNGTGTVYASHPDPAGILGQDYSDDQDNFEVYGSQGLPGFVATRGAHYTYSRWARAAAANNPELGLDTNWAYEDGSVRHHARLTADHRDERMTSVPYYSNKANELTHQFIVPRE